MLVSPIPQRLIGAGMARTALKGLNIAAQGKRSAALGKQAPSPRTYPEGVR